MPSGARRRKLAAGSGGGDDHQWCEERENRVDQAAANLMTADCLNTPPLLSVQVMESGASRSARSVKLTIGSRRDSADAFAETFHDNGPTDMVAAVKAYREVGFNGPIRPDHVPQLVDEDDGEPGYTMLGRLFAYGYIRALLQMH